MNSRWVLQLQLLSQTIWRVGLSTFGKQAQEQRCGKANYKLHRYAHDKLTSICIPFNTLQDCSERNLCLVTYCLEVGEGTFGELRSSKFEIEMHATARYCIRIFFLAKTPRTATTQASSICSIVSTAGVEHCRIQPTDKSPTGIQQPSAFPSATYHPRP